MGLTKFLNIGIILYLIRGYMCHDVDTAENILEVSLEVNGDPYTAKYDFVAGNAATLHCDVVRHEPPSNITYKFYNETSMLQDSESPEVLVALDKYSGAVYSCTARDQSGTEDSSETFINVLYPPEVELHVGCRDWHYDEQYYTEGEEVGFCCKIVSANPATEIEYHFDMNGHPSSSYGYDHRESSLYPGDTGIYSCYGTNTAGVGEMSQTYITVTPNQSYSPSAWFVISCLVLTLISLSVPVAVIALVKGKVLVTFNCRRNKNTGVSAGEVNVCVSSDCPDQPYEQLQTAGRRSPMPIPHTEGQQYHDI